MIVENRQDSLMYDESNSTTLFERMSQVSKTNPACGSFGTGKSVALVLSCLSTFTRIEETDKKARSFSSTK